jgi:selenide,water dikinase
VGIETGDDAAVWRLSADVALVQTLDFFMPFVDDPFDYGRIAAANAISDVYAMGGTPLVALAIVGLPVKKLSPDVMAVILEGGAAACADAGIPIAGGHSIDDEELKFGLCVSGTVHPDRLWRNRGARPGDHLVLTKPLGTGTLGSAVKKGTIEPSEYDALVRTATTLNRAACEAGRAVDVHACTDVTGFSLLGHARGMALASGVGMEISMSGLPVLEGARAHIAAGTIPGATRRNLEFCAPDTTWGDGVSEDDRRLVADPQTSGGLLLAVGEADLAPLVAKLRELGAPAAAVVGRVTERGERTMAVVR